MSDIVSVHVTGTPEAVASLLNSIGAAERSVKPEPWWKVETPWFEGHGGLSAAEAADLETATYGNVQ